MHDGGRAHDTGGGESRMRWGLATPSMTDQQATVSHLLGLEGVQPAAAVRACCHRIWRSGGSWTLMEP